LKAVRTQQEEFMMNIVNEIRDESDDNPGMLILSIFFDGAQRKDDRLYIVLSESIEDRQTEHEPQCYVEHYDQIYGWENVLESITLIDGGFKLQFKPGRGKDVDFQNIEEFRSDENWMEIVRHFCLQVAQTPNSSRQLATYWD
jgi:hypothetical protein